jgi:hypothetical protein
MTGRPTSLTPDIEKKVVAALQAGNYFNIACRHAGIDPATGHKWLAWADGRDYGTKGKCPKDNEPFRKFRDAVVRATADAEVHAVAMLRKAMPEDWRAAAEYLRRRNVDRWGRERVDVHVAMREYGEAMADAFRAVLEHPELKLTAKQRAAIPGVLRDVLPRFTQAGEEDQL